MPRQRPIRIRHKDKDLIRKLNKNVRAKIRRLEKQYGVTVDVETRNIKSFKTREEFNRYVESMQRFLRRQANQYNIITPKGVTIPASEFQRALKEVRRINQLKAKEFAKYQDKPFTYMGKPLKTKTGKVATVGNQWFGMGDRRYEMYKPIHFNLNNFETKTDFDRWFKRLKKSYEHNYIDRLNEQFKVNYIQSLYNVFGSNADQLAKHIERTDTAKVVEIAFTENYANIDFVYDPFDAEKKLHVLYDIWGYTG